jgi:hypothetical protein
MDTTTRQTRARAIKRTTLVGAVINLVLAALKICGGLDRPISRADRGRYPLVV